MDDNYYSVQYMEDSDVTVETNYRLNFDADRTCGYVRVYKGKMRDDDELYEIYQELLECGLSESEVRDRQSKVIQEIREGKIDVTF
ncbi:MAG TPA: hypothetical protein VKU79_04400 [Thermoplasmataceae archaeon]|nr:hypothetical protein [Thermoplasmatales archaeon AK]HLH86085.1 hypothetical protein [Thermoplasmataceae archaeon]